MCAFVHEYVCVCTCNKSMYNSLILTIAKADNELNSNVSACYLSMYYSLLH